ncbi:MAG: PepSY domain-containing protein [Gemmatimonadaceae bacterium]|nr:PepSY domain-containing protein [Gemmatimonadaceae bacterium]
MRLNVLTRRIHYWVTLGIALPVAVIIGTGVLLQVKKQWAWVQPTEIRGTGAVPVVGFTEILTAVRTVPSLDVAGWDDIKRMDIRADRGLAKVTVKGNWEVQVDLGTGKVLKHEYRRSDLIESLHDGSFFLGDVSKLGLFLPTGIALCLMWLTGLWMFWLPFSVRRKRRRALADKG